MAPAPTPSTTPPDAFVGRRAELAELRGRFADGAHLVTLWGPGGMGKTRLALELATSPGGAVPWADALLCGLEHARSEGDVLTTIAAGLGGDTTVMTTVDAGLQRLGAMIRSRGPVLVVADNVEHLADSVAPIIVALAAAAPQSRWLVTSRERLRLSGEEAVELGPLSLPSGDTVDGSDAADLFLHRARAQTPALSLDAAAAGRLAELLRRLEGIPLAIELAAARHDLLGLDGLLARLGQRLDVLREHRRGAPARHATLRGAIDWSWELLDADQQEALAAVSLFRGDFSLDAAERLLPAPHDALELLSALRDKSLIQLEPAPGAGQPRFRLLDAIRVYGAERLAARADERTVHERFVTCFVDLGATAVRAFETRGDQDAFATLGRERDNLLAAFESSLEASLAGGEPLVLVVALGPLFLARGPYEDYLVLLDRGIAAATDGAANADLAEALRLRGRTRSLCGLTEESEADLTPALELAREAGASDVIARTLADLGLIEHLRRHLSAAASRYEEAATHFAELGDRRGEGRMLGNLGAVDHDAGALVSAQRRYEQALAVFREVGDQRLEGVFLSNLAVLEQERGWSEMALTDFSGALRCLAAVGDDRLEAIALANLGGLLQELKRPAEARVHHRKALAILRKVGDRRSEGLCLGRLAGVEAALGEIAKARDLLADAEELLSQLQDTLAVRTVELWRAYLDLARARRARDAGREPDARELLIAARQRIQQAHTSPGQGEQSLVEISDDARTAVRILHALLTELDSPEDSGRRAPATLLVGDGGAWFRPPGGAAVDIRRRKTLRRILDALVEARLEGEGRCLEVDALRDAGWPEERMTWESATNRVYVAVATLRKLGLAHVLSRQEEGYRLDEEVPCARGGATPE